MERYALIFGANNFGALVLQTIITSVVVDSGGLGLAIIPQVSHLARKQGQRKSVCLYVCASLNHVMCSFFQFTIYASYFSVIAVLFTLRGLFTICKAQRKERETTPPDKTDSLVLDEHRF